MVLCCVRGCHRSSKMDTSRSFFGFPKHPDLFKKWQDFAQMKTTSPYSRICSDHFESKYIWKTQPRPLLVPDAVPTIQKPPSIIKTIETLHDHVEIKRFPLKADCAQSSKGFVVDIDEATNGQIPVIHVQSNERIHIIVTGKKCNCKNCISTEEKSKISRSSNSNIHDVM